MAKRINPDANPNNALKMYTDNIKCECEPSIDQSCDSLFFWDFTAGVIPETVNDGEVPLASEITVDFGTFEAGGEFVIGFALLTGALQILSATPSGDFAADWGDESPIPYTFDTPAVPIVFFKLTFAADEPSGAHTSVFTFETSCGTVVVTMNYNILAIELGYEARIYIAEVEEVTPGVYDIVGSPSQILNFFQDGSGPESYSLSSPVPVSTTGLFAFLVYAIANNALDIDMAQPDASAATDLVQIALNTIPDPAFPVTINQFTEQFLGAFLLDNGDPGSHTDSSVTLAIEPSNPIYEVTLVLPYVVS
jgi:hypothetical protein